MPALPLPVSVQLASLPPRFTLNTVHVFSDFCCKKRSIVAQSTAPRIAAAGLAPTCFSMDQTDQTRSQASTGPAQMRLARVLSALQQPMVATSPTSGPSSRVTVAIIGLGRQGSTIDDEHPVGSPAYGIAKACAQSSTLELIAGADILEEKRSAFQAKWGRDIPGEPAVPTSKSDLGSGTGGPAACASFAA